MGLRKSLCRGMVIPPWPMTLTFIALPFGTGVMTPMSLVPAVSVTLPVHRLKAPMCMLCVGHILQWATAGFWATLLGAMLMWNAARALTTPRRTLSTLLPLLVAGFLGPLLQRSSLKGGSLHLWNLLAGGADNPEKGRLPGVGPTLVGLVMATSGCGVRGRWFRACGVSGGGIELLGPDGVIVVVLRHKSLRLLLACRRWGMEVWFPSIGSGVDKVVLLTSVSMWVVLSVSRVARCVSPPLPSPTC